MPPKFVPRERKHRKLAKIKANGAAHPTTAGDANEAEILPTTKTVREEKRQQLRDELKANQPESKGSAKKRKRLDKYIDTKLKKEENLELLKKLAAQQVDTSLLQSSKKLGRVHESKRERYSRALQEQQAGIDVDGKRDSILYERRRPAVQDSLSEDESADSADGAQNGVVNVKKRENGASLTVSQVTGQSVVSFGSGLKRPLETDDAGQPVIKKRKRQRRMRGKVAPMPSPPSIETSEGDETDLDSEDLGDWKGFSGDESEDQSSGSEEHLDEVAESVNSTVSLDSGDSSSEDGEDNDDDDNEDKPARVSAFKAWADSQRNEAVGFTPSTVPTLDMASKKAFKPRALSPDLTSNDILSTLQPSEDAYRPVQAVVVERDEATQASRSQLPVVRDEQRIIEAINNNSVTIVCGATGSGKTTQLPQMLFENGYGTTGMIGITQPRRVAATSVAKRVADELGKEYSKVVSHQVRYDSSVSRESRIKFMTDGILLREIAHDFALSKYSAIVIDEAHERSVNTDILIGMLSRIVPLRMELSKEDPTSHHPLKLIIMSATLRVTDFLMNERLFRKTKPPIVESEGRQYAVIEHFARKTQRDYVAEMVQKLARGHKQLPAGDILVFLTGQDEIQTVAKRLKDIFASDKSGFQNSMGRSRQEQRVNDYLEDGEGRDEADSEPEITGLDEDDDADFAVALEPGATNPHRSALKAQILTLYAALPASQQDRVFEKAADGFRKIILATNVAETSLTIDGVRYVFDCGRSKEKNYDVETGVQEFKIDWISKASASQRMGRAGRTGPGHCWRLYSSAIYERYFEQHALPEILRTPIEGTVLQLKTMSVENVVNFPFPTPPGAEQLIQAERLLKNLGAIDARTSMVTDTGRELSDYPVNPRFAKMLLLGQRNEVLENTIALVAGLAVGDLLLSEPRIASQDEEDEEDDGSDRAERRAMASAALSDAEKKRQQFGRAHAALAAHDDKSDAIKILTAVALHAHAEENNNSSSFCAEYFLREKGMAEVQQLRRQLHNIVQAHAKSHNLTPFKLVPSAPTQKEISVIKQIVAAGYLDLTAIRADLLPSTVATRKPRRAIEIPYRTLISSRGEHEPDREASMQDQEQMKNVYTHANSVLARLSLSEMPSFVVYANLSRVRTNYVGEAQKRTRMHPLTSITPKQLAALAEGTPLLGMGKPIGKIDDVAGGKERICWVGIALRDPNAIGTTGWPLGAWKVRQVRQGKEWVVKSVIDRGK